MKKSKKYSVPYNACQRMVFKLDTEKIAKCWKDETMILN